MKGNRFGSALAKALGCRRPLAAEAPLPREASSAALAEDAKRSASGSLSGTGGGWTASKWTCEDSDPKADSGEIFVNDNLAERRGEFSRKRATDDAVVVKLLASALRDAATSKDAKSAK